MSSCSGRCKCHEATWAALDQAAGLPQRKHGGGRQFFETDRDAFDKKLKAAYAAEEGESDRPPSLRRVAPRCLMDRRTLVATMIRLGVPWPGPNSPLRRGQLRGRANGRATTRAVLLPGSGKTSALIERIRHYLPYRAA